MLSVEMTLMEGVSSEAVFLMQVCRNLTNWFSFSFMIQNDISTRTVRQKIHSYRRVFFAIVMMLLPAGICLFAGTDLEAIQKLLKKLRLQETIRLKWNCYCYGSRKQTRDHVVPHGAPSWWVTNCCNSSSPLVGLRTIWTSRSLCWFQQMLRIVKKRSKEAWTKLGCRDYVVTQNYAEEVEVIIEATTSWISDSEDLPALENGFPPNRTKRNVVAASKLPTFLADQLTLPFKYHDSYQTDGLLVLMPIVEP